MNIKLQRILLLGAIISPVVILLPGCGNDVEEAPTIAPGAPATSTKPAPSGVHEHSKGAGVSFAPTEPPPPRPTRRDTGAKPVVHGTANPEYG